VRRHHVLFSRLIQILKPQRDRMTGFTG
jgi:hypothetical protein